MSWTSTWKRLVVRLDHAVDQQAVHRISPGSIVLGLEQRRPRPARRPAAARARPRGSRSRGRSRPSGVWILSLSGRQPAVQRVEVDEPTLAAVLDLEQEAEEARLLVRWRGEGIDRQPGRALDEVPAAPRSSSSLQRGWRSSAPSLDPGLSSQVGGTRLLGVGLVGRVGRRRRRDASTGSASDARTGAARRNGARNGKRVTRQRIAQRASVRPRRAPLARMPGSWQPSEIVIRGAAEHNLKRIDLTLPRNKLIVITGVSGSGKSSLAFDTLYAEGQRRYVESLSAYARQFLEQMEKPDVDSIEGLSPAISIEQKTTLRNPRSTVGTVTEIYDYLRLLFARVGRPHCHSCGKPIASQSVQQIVDAVLELPRGQPDPGPGADRARPQGELPEGAARRGAPGLRPRPGRRRGARSRRGDRARQAEEAHHRDRGRPAGGPAGSQEPADRLGGDRAGRRRRAGRRSTSTASGTCSSRATWPVPSAASRCPSWRRGCSPSTRPTAPVPSATGWACSKTFTPVAADRATSAGRSARRGAAPGATPTGTRCSRPSLFKAYKVDPDTPYAQAAGALQEGPLGRRGQTRVRLPLEGHGASTYEYRKRWEGILALLERRYRETDSRARRQELERLMAVQPCPACGGARLRPESLAVTVGGKNIAEHTRAVRSARPSRSIASSSLTRRERSIAAPILKEIGERLGFLENVGLGYLTLDRAARDAVRRREPAHPPGDPDRLAAHRRALHPRRAVDRPAPARQPPAARHAAARCATWQHGDRRRARRGDDPQRRLRRRPGPGRGRAGRRGRRRGHAGADRAQPRRRSPAPTCPGASRSRCPARGATGNGKAITRGRGARAQPARASTSSFPLGVFTCVTGVSGSGKSTLVNEILYRALARELHGAEAEPGAHERDRAASSTIDKVIDIDQSPIGRTPRSNPATYIGLFTPIRELFALVPEARMRGYKPGRFSLQRQGRALRGLRGRRGDQDRDALPARRLRDLRGLRRPALQPRDAGDPVQGAQHRRRAGDDGGRGAGVLRRRARRSRQAADALRRRAGLRPAGPAGDDAVRRRGAAHQAVQGAVATSDRDARSTSSTSRPPGCTSTTSGSCSRVLEPPGRPGQHGDRHRAQPGRDQDRGLASSTSAPKGATRARSWPRDARAGRQGQGLAHRSPSGKDTAKPNAQAEPRRSEPARKPRQREPISRLSKPTMVALVPVVQGGCSSRGLAARRPPPTPQRPLEATPRNDGHATPRSTSTLNAC